MQVEAFFCSHMIQQKQKRVREMDQRNAVAKSSTTIQGMLPDDRSYPEKGLKA